MDGKVYISLRVPPNGPTSLSECSFAASGHNWSHEMQTKQQCHISSLDMFPGANKVSAASGDSKSAIVAASPVSGGARFRNTARYRF